MAGKRLGWVAVAGVATFWVALLMFGSLRPGYSQMNNAVSELGALRTPLMGAWNLLGFGIPGLLLTAFGWRLGRLEAPRAWLVPVLLAAGGASFLLSGVLPADMQNMRGTTTQLHILASMLSLLWMPGALLYAWRNFRSWRVAAIVSTACVLLFVISMGLPDDVPRGLVQRIRFAVFLGWALAMGILLLTRRSAAR